ncbi:hypothetical protein ATJ88_1181 [Isoptericola jiangsuensis]|uniref:Uncharacterized protein n=1 Tax=Isoptericola jiangsuensis TaxID=548579 RepID=A0A2A9EWI2_9MICO|nr:hypothetical protein [Isoptericola jiangsuensis]PFG42519.1 hypothetical protein ATJ88_1181 [Isoptericola jiangsuensis]
MTTLRLTDLVAGVRLFSGSSGALPATPPSAPPDDVERALRELDPAVARWVRDPLARSRPPQRWVPRVLVLPGGHVARQTSPVTCGAAVLTMLALAGDARLALRLARAADPTAAFSAAQQRVHAASTRGPAGLSLWPRALGTPPWGAAAQARFGPVRYTHRVVGRDAAAVLGQAVTAAGQGLPVPLYSGGDLSGGPGRAVPRHVVLLAGVRGSGAEAAATLYEPSSGTLHTLPVAVLLEAPAEPRARAARTRALGGWPHVVWAVLPCEPRARG